MTYVSSADDSTSSDGTERDERLGSFVHHSLLVVVLQAFAQCVQNHGVADPQCAQVSRSVDALVSVGRHEAVVHDALHVHQQ